jgi:hypothetical protein
MPGMTITKGLTDLKTLFNDIEEVYYKSSEIKASDLGASALTVDMELPVLEDGVNLDTGAADVTQIKLTTGTIWTSKAAKGDSDISLQVASIAGAVNELFLEKGAAVASAAGLIDGNTYKGSGYKLNPKKVTGALVLPSNDRSTIIVLANVEMYASLIAADGDNPAYFNVTVSPMSNSDGDEIIILEKSTASDTK